MSNHESSRIFADLGKGSDGAHAWVDPKRDMIGVFMAQSDMYLEPAIAFQNLVYQAVG